MSRRARLGDMPTRRRHGKSSSRENDGFKRIMWRAGLLYIFCSPLDLIPLPVATPATLAGCLLVPIWLVALTRGVVTLPKSPKAYLVLVLILIWSVLTTAWSVAPSSTSARVIGLIALSLSAVIVASVFDSNVRSPAAAMMMGAVVAGLLAIRSGSELQATDYGIAIDTQQATFLGIDQNALSFNLCLGFASAVFLASKAPTLKRAIFPALMAWVISISLIMVGSRTALGALAITVAISVIVSFGVGRKPGAALLIIAGMTAAGLLMVQAGLVPQRIIDWIASPVASDSRSQIIDDFRTTQSVWMWRGIGAGADADYLQLSISSYRNAHSAFWKIWIELGLVGLALWGTWLITLAVKAWSSSERTFFLIVAPTIVLFFYTLGPLDSNALWVIFGLALATTPTLSEAKTTRHDHSGDVVLPRIAPGTRSLHQRTRRGSVDAAGINRAKRQSLKYGSART